MGYGTKTENDVQIHKAWVWPAVFIVGLAITAGFICWVAVTKIQADRDVRTQEIRELKK